MRLGVKHLTKDLTEELIEDYSSTQKHSSEVKYEPNQHYTEPHRPGPHHYPEPQQQHYPEPQQHYTEPQQQHYPEHQRHYPEPQRHYPEQQRHYPVEEVKPLTHDFEIIEDYSRQQHPEQKNYEPKQRYPEPVYLEEQPLTADYLEEVPEEYFEQEPEYQRS